MPQATALSSGEGGKWVGRLPISSMATLLVTNIHTLVTMDDGQRQIRRGALWVRDNVIEQVGRVEDLPDIADEVLDLGDRHILLPGLVNTHHHFFQTLTQAIPAAQNQELWRC